jgi:hypothetical protein
VRDNNWPETPEMIASRRHALAVNRYGEACLPDGYSISATPFGVIALPLRFPLMSLLNLLFLI